MTQLDPRSPTTTTPSTPSTGGQPVKERPPFNWRVSVGMAIGLVVLFGVLFGLRALGIFPPRPAEDPEITAVRATLAALPTQQPAPDAQPTPAPTGAAPAVATAPPIPTTAPAPALAQRPATLAQEPSTAGAQFETAPIPVATSTSGQAVLTATPRSVVTSSSPAQPTPTLDVTLASAEPTPVAVNLPANLASALLQSYSNYWNIRLQAIQNPTDQSIDLESVMAGNELEGARKTLADMRDNNEAGYSNVKHTIWITHATDQAAVIVDRYVAQTIKLDPATKAPLQPEPTIERYSDTFQLQNFGGTWKVIREDAGELQ